MEGSNLNTDQEAFVGETSGEVLTLTFKSKPLRHVNDLSRKRVFFDYLDRVACCREIKVVLLKGAPTKMTRSEYIAFYREMIHAGVDQVTLERMYNAVNQILLKLLDLGKIIVHADSGDVIFLHLNIALACDYRIVADNTVYQNPNIELGVVPKGGSVFFLSKMLGATTASRILLSGADIPAARAQALGIVDAVVPLEALDRTAMEVARDYAHTPSAYAIGVKKLLNYDRREISRYLEFENELLRRLVHSCPLNDFGRLAGAM